MTTEILLAKGYLPKELPPPFSSVSFARAVDAAGDNLPERFSQRNNPALICRHRLARPGTTSRTLGIPNPIPFYGLCSHVAENWEAIRVHISSSPLAACAIGYRRGAERAVYREDRNKIEPERRSEIRSRSRYILKTDIANCYGSIYTHSIPWALHDKTVAKLTRGYEQLYGNRLDTHARNCQDGQTMGVPVGPDTSSILADLVLSAVDQALPSGLRQNSYRYVDDYEFGFSTRAEAEEALGAFQFALRKFELDLNPKKSEVVALPDLMNDLWVSKLRTFNFRSGWRQRSDLIYYWDTAVDAYRSGASKYSLRYAIKRLGAEIVSRSNWSIYQRMLLQAMLVESGTLRFALFEIVKYQSVGYDIDRAGLEANLNEIIRFELVRGRDSTASWALWCCIVLGMKIHEGALEVLLQSRDNVVALLVMDALSKGLVRIGVDTSTWAGFMSTADLRSENWLLAYEANVKGWLPSVGDEDHVALDDDFGFMKGQNVSFYQSNADEVYRLGVKSGSIRIGSVGYGW